MAYLGRTFNRSELPEQDSFEPLPPGEYVVLVQEVTHEYSKSGNGEYLKFKMQVQGPTHVNRVIYDNVVIAHQSQQAEEIGLKRFNSYLAAAGIASADDTDQLVGHTVKAKVKIGRVTEQYPDPRNDVVTYLALSGQPMPQPQPQAQPVQQPVQQQQPAQKQKPWEINQ